MIGPDATYYDRIARFSTTPKHAAECKALLAALALPTGARLLDLGCGTATLVARLQAQGFRALGIDGHDAFASHTRARPVVRGVGQRLPFRDGIFSAVILVHVLAHLQEPPSVLAEIRRVLAPGGRLGVITPNRLFLDILARVPLWIQHYHADPTVEFHRDAVTLRAELENAGLRVVTLGPAGKRAWPWPVAAARERLLAVAERPR